MASVTSRLLTNLIYRVTQSKWLIITFLVGWFLYSLPTPAGLSLAGYRILIIAVTTLLLIITEPLPLPGIAFIIIVMQVYFGVGTADQVARSFMNDAVFFIMGSLMMAVAIIQQGWDARIALGIIRLTGNRTRWIAFGLALLSAVLGSFIGEHTVTAIMLPIVIALVRNTSKDDKRVVRLATILLFSVAYGSMIGSIGTPSGGGRNAIMLVYWKEFGLTPLTYTQWMKYTYPLILLQIPFLVWILWRSYPPEYLRLDSGVRKLKVQVARAGRVKSREVGAALIFLIVFSGWIFLSDTVGLGIIALSGVILYLITGMVRWEDLNRHVNWGVVVLFGSTISLGTQIKATGAAAWLADRVMDFLGEAIQGFMVVTDSVVVLLTMLLANVLNSSATVAVLGPVNLNLPGDGIHLGLLTAIASAFGYFTAVAAPACTIIYASGRVRARDFLRVGWKMGLTSMILTLVYAWLYWPWLQ
jgi:sodium-dependent dicarboxylate transporter 2/3/5